VPLRRKTVKIRRGVGEGVEVKMERGLA